MNHVNLYPRISDKRCYIVEYQGQLDVWSVELDEPIGCVEHRRSFSRIAISNGWEPINAKV